MGKPKKENRIPIIIVGTVIVTIIIIMALYVWAQEFSKQDPGMTIAWTIQTDHHGDYVLEIMDFHESTSSLSKIGYSLLNHTHQPVIATDPDYNTVQLSGRLVNINISSEEYDQATVTINHFYSREDRNETLFITYDDSNGDGQIGGGDSIYIRSIASGGMAKAGYKFQLKYDGKAIAERLLE